MEVNEEAGVDDQNLHIQWQHGARDYFTVIHSVPRRTHSSNLCPLSLTNESRPSPVAYYLGRAADPNTFSPTARGAFGKVIYLVLRIRHIL